MQRVAKRLILLPRQYSAKFYSVQNRFVMSKKNKRKANVRTDHSHLFTDDFLRALANWQKGWSENQDKRRLIARELFRQCANLPGKFKHVNIPLYRKRFLRTGEVVPIILFGKMREGIASWTAKMEYAKDFKTTNGLLKEGTTFTVLFKHTPKGNEVVVNIISLWKNKSFIKAVEEFQKTYPDDAKPLYNFRDKQDEVVLISTLKGDEIDNIVGKSHDFDELCDMADIPDGQRENVSKLYAKDKNATPINENVFAGTKATRTSVRNSVLQIKQFIKDKENTGHTIEWPENLEHPDDLQYYADN